MFKKVVSIVLALVMVLALASCAQEPGSTGNDGDRFKDYTAKPYEAGEEIYDSYKALIQGKDVSNIKVGAIMVGDEEEGYTKAHYDGLVKAMENIGIKGDDELKAHLIVKWNIPEGAECKEAADELVSDGCNIIFANSFGHEDYLAEAAKAHPDVQFCHATGFKAASLGLPNFINYFNNVYESRYISGMYAGAKLNEMVAADASIVKDGKITIGYVGAFTYAEVVSGYSSFYLGVKAVCETPVEMLVTFTGSWASQELENQAANDLIAKGCVLISQHADTTGAASACAANGVYDVGYNVSMVQAGGDYAITSATLNWGSFYTYAISNYIAGNKLATDWSEGYETGAVKITEVNKGAFATAEAYNKAVNAANDVIAQMKSGKFHVFDISTFTVGGQTLTSTAGVDGYNGIEYIRQDGDVSYFAESTLASAPAFCSQIDGITLLNTNYGN